MSKVILITGSTDGIGKLAAQQLAQAGHRVYLHGRNARKLDQVIAAMKTETQNEHIDGFVADFSDLTAVRAMARQLVDQLPQLDVLVNNAGVFNSPTVLTPAGLDVRFVVNYLAPYVLTEALLPLLQKSEAARIINLSSAAQAPVAIDALQGRVALPTRAAYAQSKLALTMWSFHLAQQLTNSSVLAVNPGSLLNTNMVREAFGRHWSSADKGANILYDLATSEEYTGVTGRYFDNDLGEAKGAFGKAHADAYDQQAIADLLAATQELLASN